MARRMTRQLYTYTSRHTNKKVEVMCTRYEYLFLKLCYDVNGLTPEEYTEYKKYNTLN